MPCQWCRRPYTPICPVGLRAVAHSACPASLRYSATARPCCGGPFRIPAVAPRWKPPVPPCSPPCLLVRRRARAVSRPRTAGRSRGMAPHASTMAMTASAIPGPVAVTGPARRARNRTGEEARLPRGTRPPGQSRLPRRADIGWLQLHLGRIRNRYRPGTVRALLPIQACPAGTVGFATATGWVTSLACAGIRPKAQRQIWMPYAVGGVRMRDRKSVV